MVIKWSATVVVFFVFFCSCSCSINSKLIACYNRCSMNNRPVFFCYVCFELLVCFFRFVGQLSDFDAMTLFLIFNSML